MRMYDFIDPNGNGCCNLNYPPSSLDIWAPSARLGYIAGFSRSLNNRGVLDFRRPQRIDHTLGVPKDRSNLGYPEALGSPELPPMESLGTATGSLGSREAPRSPRTRIPRGSYRWGPHGSTISERQRCIAFSIVLKSIDFARRPDACASKLPRTCLSSSITKCHPQSLHLHIT